MDETDVVASGRAAFAESEWGRAFADLSAADAVAVLAADDLELLATAAFLTGRDEVSSQLWARAFDANLRADGVERAAGCAYWLAFGLVNRSEFARAGGWISRATDLLDERGIDCVQKGYLVSIVAIQALWRGDRAAALAGIVSAAEIADRFGETDLALLTSLTRATLCIEEGDTAAGVAMLDKVMATVTSGRASPIVTGLVYCAVISACQELFDLPRAQQWSAALAHWCDAQPDLVPYTGWCQIHRAEIMHVHGDWDDAVAAAERAYERSQLSTDHATAGEAFYRLGEVHRLRGDFAAAEHAFRAASRAGREPQPGSALLRLAQGFIDASAATIRRVCAEPQERHVLRAPVLGAKVEIMLEVDDVAAARAAADELAALADRYDAALLRAAAAHCTGAVVLAEADPVAALPILRSAWSGWRDLDAPYEAARTRVSIGRACRALGDEDGAQMEFDAGRGGHFCTSALHPISLASTP